MNTTKSTRKVTCPKCSGSGIVDRFLDYKGGVCFDCNGAGTIAFVSGSHTKLVNVKVTDLEIGLKVRTRTKGAKVETVTSFARHPELVIVTVVTTDAGNEYWFNPNFQSPLVFA